MATVSVHPASRFTQATRWAAGIIAGVLLSKFKLSVDPVTIAGVLATIGTFAWSKVHNTKVGRAIEAVAQVDPSASAQTVEEVAKAA